MAIAGAAFTSAFTERAKSLADWLVRNVVSIIILALLFGMLVETASHNELRVGLADAAYRLAFIFGENDPQWLHAFITWFSRPALEPLAFVGALLSGLLVFWWSAKYAHEASWLLLLLSSLSLGSEVIKISFYGFIGVTAVLWTAALIFIRQSPYGEGRFWLSPTYVVENAIRGIVLWGLTPLTLIFRLVNGLIDTVTSEKRERPAAKGAVARSPLQ
ncbi:hypothetical protein [Leucobacter sp.]